MNIRVVVRVLNLLLPAVSLLAEPVPVRYPEGRMHGFLVLRDLNDKLLATGDLMQFANGNRVTNELDFAFKDGSVYRQTTVFSQRRTFQLLTYRLIQKGPSFKRAMDMSLNVSTGQVTIKYKDQDGEEKTITDRMTLACRSRQWPGHHAPGQYQPHDAEDGCFDARRYTQAAPRETRDLTLWRG